MSKTAKLYGDSPLVFFGNERLATGVSTAAVTLKMLIENGYDVKAVVANYDAGKSRNARPLEVAEIAAQYNIPVLLPDKLKDIQVQLSSYRPRIGILVAYGKIVPEEIISLFPSGIINIHPSLLPLHRGSTPIESAILGGDSKTGVSIMRLVKGMDTGPVYGQAELPLIGQETKQELADKLLDIGQAMISELLPGILDGTLVAMPQDNKRATHDKLIKKTDGQLDFTKPAGQLEREIRAFMQWPQSHAYLGDMEIIVTKAHAVPSTGKPGEIEVLGDVGTLIIYCGQGYLCIDRLKPVGKKDMSVQEFISGYGARIGNQAKLI